MLPRAAYADATALIGLARIDRLDLLAVLSTPVRVTARVWDEVAGDPDRPGVAALLRARDLGILAIVEEGDANAYPQLDAGESTVLSAASTTHAAVLVDERKARTLINADPHLRTTISHTTGLIGLLMLAKRLGRIAAVRPLLDDLIAQSFWIGPVFYQDILRLTGEADV